MFHPEPSALVPCMLPMALHYFFCFVTYAQAELLTMVLWCDISSKMGQRELLALTSSCELLFSARMPVESFHGVTEGLFSALYLLQQEAAWIIPPRLASGTPKSSSHQRDGYLMKWQARGWMDTGGVSTSSWRSTTSLIWQWSVTKHR